MNKLINDPAGVVGDALRGLAAEIVRPVSLGLAGRW